MKSHLINLSDLCNSVLENKEFEQKFLTVYLFPNQLQSQGPSNKNHQLIVKLQKSIGTVNTSGLRVFVKPKPVLFEQLMFSLLSSQVLCSRV